MYYAALLTLVIRSLAPHAATLLVSATTCFLSPPNRTCTPLSQLPVASIAYAHFTCVPAGDSDSDTDGMLSSRAGLFSTVPDDDSPDAIDSVVEALVARGGHVKGAVEMLQRWRQGRLRVPLG